MKHSSILFAVFAVALLILSSTLVMVRSNCCDAAEDEICSDSLSAELTEEQEELPDTSSDTYVFDEETQTFHMRKTVLSADYCLDYLYGTASKYAVLEADGVIDPETNTAHIEMDISDETGTIAHLSENVSLDIADDTDPITVGGAYADMSKFVKRIPQTAGYLEGFEKDIFYKKNCW